MSGTLPTNEILMVDPALFNEHSSSELKVEAWMLGKDEEDAALVGAIRQKGIHRVVAFCRPVYTDAFIGIGECALSGCKGSKTKSSGGGKIGIIRNNLRFYSHK